LYVLTFWSNVRNGQSVFSLEGKVSPIKQNMPLESELGIEKGQNGSQSLSVWRGCTKLSGYIRGLKDQNGEDLASEWAL
jgi:hypothetical protein